MRYASRTQSLVRSVQSSWKIHDVALQMIGRGEDVIVLTVGDSDFASPGAAVSAVSDSLARGRTHYTESAGDPRLREAIARHHGNGIGRAVTPDQVIVTIGAQNALLTAAMCLLEQGDEVVVPEPMYSTYPGTIALAGATTISVPSPAANRFHPSIDAIAAAVTSRTKAIFLATPNNPTGAVYSAEELAGIGRICRLHDLWLVSDEVYGTLVYEGRHVSPASMQDLADRTVTINSLSKSHAMAGWRLGWMVAPPALAERANRMTGYVTYGIPTFVQDAAIVAVENQPYGMAELKQAYSRRRSLLCGVLSNLPGIVPHRPDGGMFVMLDVRGTNRSAFEVAWGLLHLHRVAVLPADDFGASAAGYLRINLGAPDKELEEAAARIARYAFELADGTQASLITDEAGAFVK